jgi:hypothetical protein
VIDEGALADSGQCCRPSPAARHEGYHERDGAVGAATKRSLEALKQKARRGELSMTVAIGCVRVGNNSNEPWNHGGNEIRSSARLHRAAGTLIAVTLLRSMARRRSGLLAHLRRLFEIRVHPRAQGAKRPRRSGAVKQAGTQSFLSNPPNRSRHLARMIKRATAAAGLEFKVHPHAAARLWLRPRQHGHGTRAIQGWLGHRSITSTADTALAPNRFKDFWRD